jgi:hypothetical protein
MTLIRPVVTDVCETWALYVWDIENVLDEVRNSIRKPKLRNWILLFSGRTAWNDLVQQPKPHEGF